MPKTQLSPGTVLSKDSSCRHYLLSTHLNLVFFLAILLIGLTASLAFSASPTGLVGYWPFYEGSGTTAKDFSAKGNTATLVDRKSTRLNSSHSAKSRMPSSA